MSASTRTPRKPRLPLIVAVAGLAVLVVAPNASTYRTFASVPAQPNELWVDALTWLRYNTPDPFNDPELYYTASDGVRSEAQRLNGVQSAYGVLSWWDYGYWIIRIGRRVPIANPKQTGVREVAAFLLAEEESDAASVADSLGARYVIVNGELQPRLAEDRKVLAGFLENMAGALGEQLDRYIRVVYRSGSNGREPVILYEAPFYRTMMSRLYRTGHDPAQGQTATWVVTLSERGQDGSRYWELLGETPFSSYEEAQAFVAAARSPNMRIVGKDPFVSCVPQQSLQRFVRVYRSLARDMHEGRPGPPVVQIFERRSDAPHVTNPRVSRINNSVEAPPQD